MEINKMTIGEARETIREAIDREMAQEKEKLTTTAKSQGVIG